MMRILGVLVAASLSLGAARADALLPALAKAGVASPVNQHGLAEPLVRAWQTGPVEDAALSVALGEFADRRQPDDFRALTSYLDEHPQSGWRPALLTDLGLAYRHYGYFSRALASFREAWEEGRGATEPDVKAIVDRAVGELAELYASLGHTDNLRRLFEELQGRSVGGSATEAVQEAREMLSLVDADPRHLFICGPLALKAMLAAGGAMPESLDFLQWYRAGPKGTSLAEVANLARRAGASYRLLFREPGQPVPIPSVVHWKVGHFAAIVGEANGRLHVQDSVFNTGGLWVTRSALDAEASGYFLVPQSSQQQSAYREVALAEAETVWGKGPTNGTRAGGSGDPTADQSDPTPPRDPDPDLPLPTTPTPDPTCGMCRHSIKESSVSINIWDVPVGYTPPIGPSARTRISYNQREDSQPAVFSFYNVSPKWTLNWLSYVSDDPTNLGGNVSRFLSGGGAFYYLNYNSSTGSFAPQDDDGSILTLVSNSPVTYQRRLRDGSVEIYAQSDGSTAYPRNTFLTRSIDAQGNAMEFTYDGLRRLTSLTDATGGQTIFTYGLSARPLLVTKITDPFGRSATLGYDAYGRLTSITDVMGITSTVSYDANSLVNSLTTPYGTTTFAFTTPGTSGPPRFAEVTDPMGYHEREEWLEPAPIPDSEPSTAVPLGMPLAPVNQYLTYRNSFYWNKDAYTQAGCTPTGGCDYTKARIRHFVHMPGSSIKGTAIESVKYPLENRIWYNYPGQTSPIYGGTSNRPIAIGRVLDDGTTQLSQFSYDTSGFNLTKAVDPLGRTTHYTYAPNGIDLLAVTRVGAGGSLLSSTQYAYDGRHRPLVATNAAGQTTFLTYNGAGQLASRTDPLSQKTSLAYDSQGYLTAVTNPNGQTAASFTYDQASRVRTATDSEGWTVTYDYDDADRVTSVTYPDGTSQVYTYDRLDLVGYRDRQFRFWQYAYDSNRRMTAVTDPIGGQTLLAYNGRNQVTSLTDPKGYLTSGTYDVQGRPTTKRYSDTSTVAYNYETTTSRLKSVTDALGQVKQFAYAKDDRLAGITYANAANPTPNLAFAWDPYVPRPVSMTDGTGTTRYTYGDAFTFGAGRLKEECLTPTGGTACTPTIAYEYDALGRMTSRSVAGAGPETFAYDALGRLTGHGSDLGAFGLTYLGQTGQIAQRQLLPAASTLRTTWSYLPNSGDRRLASISNTGLSAGQFTNLQFETTPQGQIASVTETSDAPPVYPSTLTQTASYNNLNELTTLSGQALTYDLNGNLTSDGQRSYAWDAENRLTGITYPGSPGKATTFTYDGLDRRVTISETPAGGGIATTTGYLWCGAAICQSRNASGARLRSYYGEGEFVAGMPGQSLYYGIDQVGTVRRVFASGGGAPVYTYDPYGVPLGSTPPGTEFTYAGMFRHAPSGLNFTQYRAYDPVPGRWISRDRLTSATEERPAYAPSFGSTADGVSNALQSSSLNLSNLGLAGVSFGDAATANVASTNLYLYAWNNPIKYVDTTGLAPRDQTFGLPRPFWRWYHRYYKQPGDPDLTFGEACDIYDQWCQAGCPRNRPL